MTHIRPKCQKYRDELKVPQRFNKRLKQERQMCGGVVLQVGRWVGAQRGVWKVNVLCSVRVARKRAGNDKNNTAASCSTPDLILLSRSPFLVCMTARVSARQRARVPLIPSSCGVLHPGQCLVAVLNCRRDLLSSGSRVGGEFPGVPAGLLVHKPGVSGPDEHVEEAEHLEGQHRGRFIKEIRGKVG